MSINKPAIAAGPTQWIARTYGGHVPIVPVIPGNMYMGTDETGRAVMKSTDPSAEGQLMVYETGSGNTRTMSLYVAVDISDTLTWKKASILEGSNRYTNQQDVIVF